MAVVTMPKDKLLFSGTRGTAKGFLSENKARLKGFKITRTGKLASGAWGIFGRKK
tara:strand:+ start:3595 stop:3759 length:165 start_codon:yes stop_codon:yes gene_type:complete